MSMWRTRRDRDNADIAAGHASGAELFGGTLVPTWARPWDRRSDLTFLGTLRRLPHLIARSLRLGWAADRTALLAVVTAEIAKGFTSAFGLLATNQVLVRLFMAGPTPSRVRAAFPSLVLVSAAGALGALLGAVSTAATGRLEPKVERSAEVELLAHVIRVEMSTAEDAEFKRLYESGRFGTDASRQMITYSVKVVNALISLAAVGTVLAVLHPLLLPLLVLIIVPPGWGSVRSARRRYRSRKDWLDHNRQQFEVGWSLSRLSCAQEIRVHAVGPYLLDHYRTMAAAAEAEKTRLARAEAFTDLGTSALSGLASGLTYVTLGWLLLTGRAGLATSGTAVLAIRTGTSALSQLVTGVNQLYEQALSVTDLVAVCALAETHAIPTGGSPLPPPEVVEATDVVFTYPGRTRPALDKVSIRLRRGRIIALAGENGSGKTTLAKILAGLYVPDSGTVRWDGVDVADADRDTLFGHVALVQQDFPRWEFTARTNVVIGRPRTGRGPDAEAFAAAEAYAETDRIVDDLPRGWDTLLDRSYEGGVQLSGGQWQRLVLARAHYRNASVVIFDEPTAALDARAERDAFDRIRGLVREGATVVLITHRLASVRLADDIYVLEEGRVVEQGTHDELLALGGVYADMFAIQADQFGAHLTEGPGNAGVPASRPPAAAASAADSATS